MRLNTLHNLHFFLRLMERAREAIDEDRFGEVLAWVKGLPEAP